MALKPSGSQKPTFKILNKIENTNEKLENFVWYIQILTHLDFVSRI